MLTEAMQKELEEERNIQRLNTVLVKQIHHGIESGEVEKVPYGDYAKLEFNINCIPEELRDLFRERLPVLRWGEISAGDFSDKKYYYLKDIEIGDEKVKMVLIRNW